MLRSIVRCKKLLVLCLLPAMSISCQKSGDGKAYRFNGQVNVDGRTRTYLLNLPPNYYDTSGFALVVALHGFGGSASEMEKDYGITEKANAEHFIVVYPEGVPSNGPLRLRTWNTGSCCGYAQDSQVDDVTFIRTLIDQLVGKYHIDPKRVYVTGMSNGAMMTYTLAARLSDRIAAIAPVSGTMMMSEPCAPGRAVPILHIHSQLDTKVPFAGGVGLAGYYFMPVDSTLNVWSAIDSCDTPPVVIDKGTFQFTEWKDAAGRPAIDLYLTYDGGHSWPGGQKPREQADPPSTAINATDLIWDFFQRYRLP